MWMKIDDGLHSHRKTRRLLKNHPAKRRDASPFGIWVLAGSWASQNGTDGWVPEDELERFDDDWRALAARLVRAGYWWPQERDGESGFGFNDWHDYNPEAEAASRSGVFGNHIRWHANKGIVDPTCEHCPREPIDPEAEPESPAESGGDSHPDRGGISGSIALPVPGPTPARPDPTPSTSGEPTRRDDVEAICEHLAGAIEANGSKRPTVTTRWRQAARLMLDKDGRTEDEVHGAIEWSQRDEFWRANILSLPTLREKYDTLRLQAQRKNGGSTSRNEEWRAMQERQMARALEREREMGLR